MNNRMNQILLKVIDEFFDKEIGKTQERFRKRLLEICRKEKASVEKVFFVMFSFYLLLMCLSQSMICCVLQSETKNWKMILFLL